MRPTALVSSLVLFAAGSLPLVAGVIPYGNIGSVAPQNSLTAMSTGNVTGYFVQGGAASGGSAADLDFVQLYDVTSGTMSGYLFNNQTTVAAGSANFGFVTAGDTLVFELEDTSTGNDVVASEASLSADGVNHAYTTSFSGGTLNGAMIPAGTFVGMEDRLVPGSDLNYNDDSFVFTNVAATAATPEPTSLLLLGTGALGAVGAIRRRFSL